MAATAPPEIQVYAPFPRAVALGADLNVDPSNWRWVLCLTLPLATLNALQLSPKPYKWIRYAIGVVVGAEGGLSSSPDLPNVIDYDAGLPAESAVLYYHTSDEERRRMFPADPNIGHTRITSSVATARRAEFRDGVAERDGRACVLSGMQETSCDAVHLLAHSKGDAYISTYTHRRSRDPFRGDIVQDIDSVRNGLFLNKVTHASLGKDAAFLRTPNFAMNTSDIDPTAPPAEQRCTAHLFRPDTPSFFRIRGREILPSGSPLRISDNTKWPPAILFDAVYAGAVLHHFGTQILKDEVAATWKDTCKVSTDERVAPSKRSQNQAEEREARYEARGGPDTLDMLMALPYILVPPNELQAVMREAKEKAEAEEQKRVQEKVNTWMEQMTAT